MSPTRDEMVTIVSPLQPGPIRFTMSWFWFPAEGMTQIYMLVSGGPAEAKGWSC